jgi:glutamate/tyrosine decarboxylase-like PLP-dependent enzyme
MLVVPLFYFASSINRCGLFTPHDSVLDLSSLFSWMKLNEIGDRTCRRAVCQAIENAKYILEKIDERRSSRANCVHRERRDAVAILG